MRARVESNNYQPLKLGKKCKWIIKIYIVKCHRLKVLVQMDKITTHTHWIICLPASVCC